MRTYIRSGKRSRSGFGTLSVTYHSDIIIYGTGKILSSRKCFCAVSREHFKSRLKAVFSSLFSNREKRAADLRQRLSVFMISYSQFFQTSGQ